MKYTKWMKGLENFTHELVFVGRGGQGVVTASRILAEAALVEGKFVQSFPEFGPERSGAPVKAYARVSNTPIEIRAPVEKADTAVYFETRLIHVYEPTTLTRPNGVVVVSCMEPSSLPRMDGLHVFMVNGRRIVESLNRPLSLNMVMLGATVAATRIVSLETLRSLVAKRFSPADVKALENGFEEVVARVELV